MCSIDKPVITMKKYLSRIILMWLFLFCLVHSANSQILIMCANEKANDRMHTNQQLLPSAPSQSDLDWALGLQQSVQEGYRTTVEEIERYTAIYKQYQQQQQENNNGRSDKSKAESDEEMMWALQLLDSFQHGKIPTDEEIEKYAQIIERWNQHKSKEQSTPHLQQQNTDTTVKTQSNNPSDKELEWAKQLEMMVGQGYTPNAQENAQYEDIFKRLIAQQSNENTKANSIVSDKIALPVSQQEIEWAVNFEAKVKQGYQANTQDTAKYQDIIRRYAAQYDNRKNNKGYIASDTVASTISQYEIQWALQLEEKVKGGYVPNAEEFAQYKNIASRLSAQQSNEITIPNSIAPNKVTTYISNLFPIWPKPYPSVNAQDDDKRFPAQQANAEERSTQPLHQPAASSQKNDSVALSILAKKNQDKINWALMIEQKADSSSYQPTSEETALYQSIATKLSKIENAADTSASYSVSNVELDWALQVQERSNKKQKLFPEELKLYENIYRRWSTKKLKPLRNK